MDDNQNINTNINSEEAPQEKKRFTPKNYLIIFIVLFVLLNIFLFSWTKATLKKAIKITTSSPTPTIEIDPVLAEVGSQKIYKNDVQALAEKQVSNPDQEVLNAALGTIIERKILEGETKKLNITVTDEEVRANLSRSGLASESSSLSESFLEVKKYEILKNKLIPNVLESRTAFIIGFWVPPYSTQRTLTLAQKNTIAKQRRDGDLALSEIEKKLKNQEDPFSVAQFIYDKHASLQPILAVNGYIFEESDKNYLQEPRTYILKKLPDTPIFQALNSMNVNEVKKVMDDDGAGGSVIFLKSINTGQPLNYEEWLEQKKKELVKIT